MENGTAQAEEKCGHASDLEWGVEDEASGVGGYKRIEARLRFLGVQREGERVESENRQVIQVGSIAELMDG